LDTLTEFDQQELTNTSWAFAEIRFRHMPLIEARLRPPSGMKKRLKDDEDNEDDEDDEDDERKSLGKLNFLTLFDIFFGGEVMFEQGER